MYHQVLYHISPLSERLDSHLKHAGEVPAKEGPSIQKEVDILLISGKHEATVTIQCDHVQSEKPKVLLPLLIRSTISEICYDP